MPQLLHNCYYRKELERERDKVEQLRDALEALQDEQNGPPLERHRSHWQMAMDKTAQAIADTK